MLFSWLPGTNLPSHLSEEWGGCKNGVYVVALIVVPVGHLWNL